MRLALAALIFLSQAAAAAPDLSSDNLLLRHLWHELKSLPKEKRPTVGLVLSAGSLRGVAHVGVIKVLEQADFPVDVVAGTSMGAVVGSLYAAGWSADRLERFGSSLEIGSGTNLGAISLLRLVLFDKLLSSKATEDFFRKNFSGIRFEELPKPFACVAMDIHTGESIVFREGDLAKAVRSSMNLPGIFAPIEYRHRYLVDGGVVNYIPVDAARLIGADWVLASVTESDYTKFKPKNVLEALEQVIDIRGAFLSRDQRTRVDFLIEPEVGDIGLHEVERAQEAIDKGVIAAKRKLPQAMESLLLYSLPALAPAWVPEPLKP